MENMMTSNSNQITTCNYPSRKIEKNAQRINQARNKENQVIEQMGN
jgi:hypothetical protein